MYIDIIKPTVKSKTITRVDIFDLLDDRSREDYNALLEEGVIVTKRIHKMIPGVPGNEFEESTLAQLIEIVTYIKEENK